MFDTDVCVRLRPTHKPSSIAISELEQFSSRWTCLPVKHGSLFLKLLSSSPCASPPTSTNLLPPVAFSKKRVAFVQPDEVDSSKTELATELSRTRRLASHEIVTG